MFRVCVRGLILTLTLGFGSAVYAQNVPDRRWSVDFGIGWDNGISGNINSSAIGVLNNQTVVILKNQHEDVYGTGLHIRFGGGFMLDEESEVRVTFTLQSLDADLVRMGDLGASNLYAQYDDYQSFGLDVGYRQYMRLNDSIRAYGEGTVGLAFIDEIDVELAAPQANFTGTATDFYDGTAAFTLGGNIGVLFEVRQQLDVFTQIGLRYVTGMADVDAFEGTGLDAINDKSGRWAIPLVFGARVRF